MDYKNYSKQDIAAVCLHWGPILDHWLSQIQDGRGGYVQGSSLLFAICGNESSFGANCKPRYERAYDIGGPYFDVKLHEQFGEDAPYSYGPTQIMLCNAPGFTPSELATDLEKAMTATVGYIHRYILTYRKAVTLEEIFETYNSGHFHDANNLAQIQPRVQEYVQKGMHNYFNEVLTA